MDKRWAKGYLEFMASIMTLKEQRQAGRAARRVGGYMKLIELQAQRREPRDGRIVTAGRADGEHDGAAATAADRPNAPRAG